MAFSTGWEAFLAHILGKWQTAVWQISAHKVGVNFVGEIECISCIISGVCRIPGDYPCSFTLRKVCAFWRKKIGIKVACKMLVKMPIDWKIKAFLST